MALVTAKVLKDFKEGDEQFTAGQDIVIKRKEAVQHESLENLEIGRVLDPRNEADKPLVDAYLEAHPVAEIETPQVEESEEEQG